MAKEGYLSGTTGAVLPQGNASATLCVALAPLPSKPRHVWTLTPGEFTINGTTTMMECPIGETAQSTACACVCISACIDEGGKRGRD